VKLPLIGFGSGLFVLLMTACTPAQLRVVESGVPSDAALVGCVVLAALDGESLAAVAQACETDALTAGGILIRAVTSKGAVSVAQGKKMDRLAGTPASVEALSLAKQH
jgi:hypothetical protein